MVRKSKQRAQYFLPLRCLLFLTTGCECRGWTTTMPKQNSTPLMIYTITERGCRDSGAAGHASKETTSKETSSLIKRDQFRVSWARVVARRQRLTRQKSMLLTKRAIKPLFTYAQVSFDSSRGHFGSPSFLDASARARSSSYTLLTE